ncbi:VWA domain-containing protein [Dactylosporangium sp. CA-152071]|uniref:VWA domain-containing protein n=1 Tax=Dactylosporangium sp. CA-152071 TaxID=3239933 RepID=UPI003D91B148
MPSFVRDLVTRLRRRGLPLGVDDCAALRTALAAGHGLDSPAKLRALCVTLWAKSPRDAELINATMHLVRLPDWPTADTPSPSKPADVALGERAAQTAPGIDAPTAAPAPEQVEEELTVVVPPRHAGPAEPPHSGMTSPFLVVRPQYPVAERDVAQIWRRLRRPVRRGPLTEVDVDATVDRFARTGLAEGPVLVPRRVNAARLLLLVDRDGSMAPYHGFVDHVVGSVVRAGRLDDITVAYFRNTPGRSRDRSALASLPGTLAVDLDPILDRVPPLNTGRVYRDPEMLTSWPVADLLSGVTPATVVAAISDAGALRGAFVTTRLFDTVAFALSVLRRGARLVWLNPVASDRWPGTTAGQIARHVPMYPLTRAGMYGAVDALRGHPVPLERPL